MINSHFVCILQIIDNQTLHLSGCRVVLAIKYAVITDKNKCFWIVNTHLHHEVPDWQIRLHQIEQLHLWL